MSFHDAFAHALFAPDTVDDPAVQALVAQPAFAVYRNTVMKGCIDALEANFPAVARLVGSEWFRAAAALHVAGHPPRDGRLLVYGDDFAAFLQAFEPAAGLSYLSGVARLDALWREAHAAGDAASLDTAWLARHEPDALAALVLRPHPATRWAWFDDQPVYSIWARNRSAAPDESELAWRGEGALMTRPFDSVNWCGIDQPACAFLDACAGGEPLAAAAERALAVDADADIAALLASLLRAGAFTTTDHSRDHR
ncbi:DNA-binding domain-containing protein [Variovorax sp. KK3]|uniref:HvfC/BufC N-terminal domain-containing protein n=1 Tax=Variovorax sp. KK3 TaxID=1855728 RepID=UPI00097BF025|nr:DNA-binding domain-containing protein [Variovorax sp. KK3]